MKKQLLSMTALVAVGLIAALAASSDAEAAKKKKKKPKAKAPKLTVAGYTTAGWTYADNGDTDGRNTGGLNAIWDSEIAFKVAGQMDNGVKLKAQVDMEGGIPNETDNVDDAWLSLSGAFGELIIGETDGAGIKVARGAMGDWATSQHSIPFQRANIVPAPSGFASQGPGFSIYDSLNDGDDPKTTYITPVMNGFQAGVSYMKDPGKGADSIAIQTSTNTVGENWYSIGMKYSGKMGKTKLEVAAAYTGLTIPSLGDDIVSIAAGGNVESGPWKVAIGFMTSDDPGKTSARTSQDGQSWSAGIKYTAGAHKYSLATFKGKIAGDPSQAGDDESTTYMLAHNYAVSAGVTWINALVVSDYDGEGTGATQDQKGMGVHSAVKFTF
jgi:hypothetical protein